MVMFTPIWRRLSNNGTGSLLYSTEAYHIIPPQYIMSISFPEKKLLMIKSDTHLSRSKPSAILEVTTHFVPYSLQQSGLAYACIVVRDRFGDGVVLVWGGIMGGNKTRLIVINGNINAQTYINDVLAVEATAFIQFHSPNVTFMHDNARLQ